MAKVGRDMRKVSLFILGVSFLHIHVYNSDLYNYVGAVQLALLLSLLVLLYK